MRDAQLNVYNLRQMRAQPRESFDFIRFDPNNDCNVHCVYCHNHRSKEMIPTEELLGFFDENVDELRNFQMGCVMEPTLDERLADLLLLVGRSPRRPTNNFTLQTNGILLHKHDLGKFRDAGLNEVSVSIDAPDAETHRKLRGGTSIAKVGRNIANLRKECPDIRILFITTVTRLNIGVMRDLVAFGIGLGVSTFTMREVFHHPDSNVVDHSRMREIVLGAGEFSEFSKSIIADLGAQAHLMLVGNEALEQFDSKIRRESFR